MKFICVNVLFFNKIIKQKHLFYKHFGKPALTSPQSMAYQKVCNQPYFAVAGNQVCLLKTNLF
jgi:hypothetical protein